MKNIAIVAVLTVLVAVPLAAATYTAPHTFVPGEQIKSSLFNDMNTALAASINNIDGATQVDDSAIVTANLGANCVGNFAIGDNAIQAEQMNYTDSSKWDTMPVRMFGGVYTGDSSVTGQRIYCSGIRPMHVDIIAMPLTAAWTYAQDVRWDTTAAYCEYATNQVWSDTSASGYGAVRITKGDTEFVVYAVVAGSRTPNQNGVKFAYSGWGY